MSVMERFDKIISHFGGLTRREAKLAIRQGRALYNGRVVLAEQSVDTVCDSVTLDGRVLPLGGFAYLMLHKPADILSAARDSHAKTVVDLVPKSLWRKGLFPAGRLDKNTTGFILLTDDGSLAHRMLTPKKHVYKTYEMQLEIPLDARQISLMESGMTLHDGTQCLPAEVCVLVEKSAETGENWAQIRIREGKYHQIKRMAHVSGNEVLALKRTAIGALRLDPNLREGDCRALTREEVALIFSGE